jgi:hypothetical protein
VPRGQGDGSLQPYSRFSRQEPLLFYQVAPQLYSRGWVDPVPDTLLFFVVPGNRTRDPCICSQELWPLDHRGGQENSTSWTKYYVFVLTVRKKYCYSMSDHFSLLSLLWTTHCKRSAKKSSTGLAFSLRNPSQYWIKSYRAIFQLQRPWSHRKSLWNSRSLKGIVEELRHSVSLTKRLIKIAPEVSATEWFCGGLHLYVLLHTELISTYIHIYQRYHVGKVCHIIIIIIITIITIKIIIILFLKRG